MNIKINVKYNNVVINNNNESKKNNEDNKWKKITVDSPPKKYKKTSKKNHSIYNIKISGKEASKGKSSSLLRLSNNNKEKNKTLKSNEEATKKDITNKKNNNNNNNLSIANYNDYEINSLIYKEAIIIDKRNYFEYYLSLLRRKHILIFTFYTSNDYNSKEIKICLFFFSFALYITVNALFFNDSTMHKIYEDSGRYNFVYQLPQILYSTLISSIINLLANFLSLSEKNILSLKNRNSTIEVKKDVINRLIIKFILFFVLIYILLFLFWYYLACFCAVYINTQIHLIKDTLISYGLYLLYPFCLCLVPGIFRIPSLATKKTDKECLYKFSNLLQLI